MDNKKFEQLIELVINEDQEKAEQLFHEIVVEKSREIYESIMDEEMMGMEDSTDEGMGGQVGDLLDEINAEEQMSEDEDPMDDAEVIDIDAEEMGGEEEHEEIEDAVVRIEDKLDQLMAEFEELMGGDEEGEEDFGDEEGEEDVGAEEGEEDLAEADDLEEEVMEAITLKKVSVTHGDNGANTKSPALHDPKVKAAGVSPVKFSGHDESVPTGPKGPSNAYTKGETQVKGAGSFKNAPAQASQDLEKAPAPKHGDSGANTKSPLGESKKVAKKRV